ncbi:MAG: SCO family protein [Acidobacteriota bacterium]|nr:SCO family protein [Acidobacteriota bacterium]
MTLTIHHSANWSAIWKRGAEIGVFLGLLLALFVTGSICLADGPAPSTQSLPALMQGAATDSTHGAPTTKQIPALLRGVGIDQKLNQQIPLNLPFKDASGKTVLLGEFFGKRPVILSLVYFNCPMLCTMTENNLVQSLRLITFDVGKQYDVLTVSFDPTDTSYMAADKRAIYLGMYGRKGAAEGWHFLTGDQASITALTDAVGFHYNYIPATHQYAHAVGIIVLTPQGRISKYFYGVQYPAGTLRLALDQASNDKIGTPVDALILYCCEYNPLTGKYDLIVDRALMVGGIITILCIGGLILILSRSKRNRLSKA